MKTAKYISGGGLAALLYQLAAAPADPTEDRAPEGGEVTHQAQRVRTRLRIHAVDGQLGQQVRSDEHQLLCICLVSCPFINWH